MTIFSTPFTVSADYDQVLHTRQAVESAHFVTRYNVQMTWSVPSGLPLVSTVAYSKTVSLLTIYSLKNFFIEIFGWK